MNRQDEVDRFYSLLNKVSIKFPQQYLADIAIIKLPKQGVYFFFENGETRGDNLTNRIVRVGTHAAIAKSKATLYKRLYNHKGSNNLTGNHRSSVFRKLIGSSFLNKYNLDFRYWGDKSKKSDSSIKNAEKPLEVKVSEYISSMRFIVLEVQGPSAKNNDRALIEENTIGLLSNFKKDPIDKSSEDWLGLFSADNKVISSGLWNRDWVDKSSIDERYFDAFEHHLSKMSNWL